MSTSRKIAVLYHIFYEDTVDTIVTELESLHRFQPIFFFNVSTETPNALLIKQTLLKAFPGSIVTLSSNKGKDIGGKLVLLNTCLEIGIEPDWILFLHDKKSLQSLNSKAWKADLMKIINSDSLGEIDRTIAEHNKCGIIATQGYVVEERNEKGT